LACSLCLAVAAMLAPMAGAPEAERPPTPDWVLEEHPGVLQMRLAHDEGRRVDGGVLTVDSNRRVVLWEGIPGELGCRRKLEVPFGGVRAVRDEPDGVIRLEIKGQPRDRWLFVPLPHAAWLMRRTSALMSGPAPGVRDVFVGPDGFPIPLGGSGAFAGPQLRPDLVPSEVTNDVRLGVERIREALGRRPAPSVKLYEALNGRPVEVSIADVVANPAPLEGRSVRVHGIAGALPHDLGLALTDEGSALRVVPQPELESLLPTLVRAWRGQEVEVSGVLRRSTAGGEGAPSHEVAFWEYIGPETLRAATEQTPRVTVEEVVERAAELSGRTVRVVGRFRGNNLEHDLAEPGPHSAWVIKAGRHAIWVTGHKPSGPGFSLHPERADDTRKWVEVLGRVEIVDGRTTLRARAVALAAPAANVRRGRVLKTARLPEVVFTLPLTDRDPVAPRSVFLVQFSTYMDEQSFEGRVRMQYSSATGAEQELRRVRWSYDDSRRTLIVEPGEPLRPGASVELLLLPGITDTQATPLGSRGPEDNEGALRTLHWRVEG
jgi:hypothetical protein